MPFCHSFKPRFHEVDRAGIIFFGRVFEYAHVAFEELLFTVFGNWDQLFHAESVGLPLVNAESNFHAPIRQGQNLEVKVRVVLLSKRSLTFEHRIEGAGGKLHAVVRLTHAAVNLTTFKSCALPEFFIRGLRSHQLIELEECKSE